MQVNKKIQEYVYKNFNQYDNPFYIYDTDIIREKCRLFHSLPYENKSVHFATMSNSNPDFLKIIRQQNIKVFVNSLIHLNIAKKAGFEGNDIVFTASSLDKKTIEIIHDEKAIINLDSINQLNIWKKLYPGTKTGLRCNLMSSEYPVKNTRAGQFTGNKSRLGITSEELMTIKNKRIISGLHIYPGTDIYKVEYFIRLYKTLTETAISYPELEYLDLGGGFGLNEKISFNFKKFGNKVLEIITDYNNKTNKNIRLIFEPGRIISSESGYFICRVTDIKYRDNMQYIGVNASSVQFPRPLFYPGKTNHPVILLNEKGKVKSDKDLIKSKIMGCSTYSKDFLSHLSVLPPAKIGDTVIFSHSGAYCASSYTEFLGFPKSKEIFI